MLYLAYLLLAMAVIGFLASFWSWLFGWRIGSTTIIGQAGNYIVNLMKREHQNGLLRLVLKRSGDGRIEVTKRIAVNGEEYIQLSVDSRGKG